MRFSQPATALEETQISFTAQSLIAAGLARCRMLRPVSPHVSSSLHLVRSCPLLLVKCQRHDLVCDEQGGDSDDNCSLMSGPGDILPEDDAASTKTNRSHCLDVTGLALLYKIEFWQLWILMGLLTGVGLMTIK